MTDLFLVQAAVLFWAALCLFRVGAMTRGIVMTRRAWGEIVQAAAIVVIAFGLLTGGSGCRSLGSSTADMVPPCDSSSC